MKLKLKIFFKLAIVSLVISCEGKSIDKEINTFSKRLDFELNLFRENIKTLVDTSNASDGINTTGSQPEMFRSDIGDDGNNSDNENSRESRRRESYLMNGLKSEKEFIRKEVEDMKLKIMDIEKYMNATDGDLFTDIDETKTLIGFLKKRQNVLELSMKEISEATSTDKLNKMISREVKQAENNLKRELDEAVIPTKRDTQVLQSKFSEQEKYINDIFTNISARLQKIEARKECGIWAYFQGSCYFYHHKVMNWANARKECLSLGGNLVEIDNKAEDQFIIELIDKNIKDNMYGTWFGASDIDKEGHWKWAASGKMLQDAYSHWTGSEPNGGRRENCLHWLRHSRKWNDSTCNSKYDFICEKKI